MQQETSATMPTATTTKSAMAGTKRKSSPVKNGHVKESKKPKIESGLKSALKSKPKSEPKKLEEASDLDSDSDSDGGAPLNDSLSDLDDEEEGGDSSEEEAIPKVEDGLHPERAKAAATNSKFTCSCGTIVN
jgi:pumilio family protein 6